MNKWLLIPMQPTPNGRLHIGHGGGPYLRADAIARALRRGGHHVKVITGSDAYENWVLADAFATGRTPEHTCQVHHAGIASDLARLGVEPDTWIDPLSPDHNQGYREIHERLFTSLRQTGAAVHVSERVPIGARTGRELLGVWIAGRCPTCGADAGGNTCTACSDHFTPEQLIDPRSRLTDEPITWTSRDSWFAAADPAAVLPAVHATGLPDRFLTPVRTYLSRPNPRIRLSQPGDWGISSPLISDGTVLANSYYAYSLYCAQLYDDTTGNALDADSGITVVGLFGTDNSIAGLVAPHALAAGTGFKAFDHTVVSHMLHYRGRKCSTSKRHGIWIADLIDNTSVTSDELRWVLASIPLDHQVSDIDTGTIVQTVNTLRSWRSQTLGPTLETAATQASEPFWPAVTTVLDAQSRHLTPPTVDLAAAHRVLQGWMLDEPTRSSSSRSTVTWLVGTALLAAPILPNLAAQLWAALSLPRVPPNSRLAELASWPRPVTPSAVDTTSPGNLTDHDVAHIAK